MKYHLVWILLLGGWATLIADDPNTLLETQREYVAELLALKQPKLAQQHLDIIRKEFPKEVETICFYQGQISFTLNDYKTAVENFAKVLEQQPSELRRQLVVRHLVEGYTRLGKAAEAHALLKDVPPTSGKGAWYPEACRELAEAVHQGVADQSARSRVPAKKDTVALLKAFEEKFPTDPQIPWVKYYLAEYEYDRLIALLLEKGKIKREDSPVTIDKTDDVIIVQLHQTRRLFQAIKDAYPKHAAIPRVDPRLKYLNLIIDRVGEDQ